MNASDIIRHFNLEPLPEEGGYYRETYRSKITIPPTSLPEQHSSERTASTIIYYLLTKDSASHIHRLKSDEMFYFHYGVPVSVLLLYSNGKGEIVTLGTNFFKSEVPQLIIPAGTWFGAYIEDRNGQFALLSTSVSPGFEFEDYEHGSQAALLQTYPDFTESIIKLTN